MAKRSLKKTRYPGIYAVQGVSSPRFMVSFRIHGLGQRTKTFTTLRDAREFQGSVRDPVRTREMRQRERGRVSLSAYFPQWLERRRNLTPSTRLRYEGVGRHYISPTTLGRLDVSTITRDDVEDWISGLERSGVHPPTIDKAYRTLRACLETAVMEGKAGSNPAKRIHTPELQGREPFFLTANEVDAIASEVAERDRALVYFLAYTGARIGEATALRVRNLYLLGGVARIVENSPEVAGRKVEGAKTKTKQSRSITLPAPLVSELATHLDHFGIRLADGSLDQDSYVFTGERGAQVRQNNWRTRVFQRACERARVSRPSRAGGTEVPRVHDLRHTAASLAASAGYTLHEVKEMLGHSTIKTTSDQYLHLFEEGRREKADLLGALMTSALRERGRVVSLEPRLVAEGTEQ